MKSIRMELGMAGIMLALALGAYAAEPSASPTGATLAAAAQPLTLDRTVALAYLTDRNYQMQLEKAKQADARWWQALLALGPTASVQGSYLLDREAMDTLGAMGVPAMPGVSSFSDMFSAAPQTSGRVVLTQPLFTGGKLLNALRLAALQRDMARDSAVVAKTQLLQDITKAYGNLLVSEQLVKVTEAALDSMQKHLEIVKARYREGAASNFEVLRAQVQVANLQPNLLKLQTAQLLAQHTLATMTGLTLDQTQQLAGSLTPPDETWPTVGELKVKAAARRLEFKNLTRAKQMAETGHALALAGNAPMLALNATWGYADYLDKFFPPAAEHLYHGWDLTVGLNWPIWDNLAVIPKVNEAASKVREADLGLKALEAGIQLEVEAAHLALTTAQQTLALQKQTVALAQESYRLAEQQYQNGLATNLDVMDAQIALNQAETNTLQSQYDLLLAGLKLHQAIGDTAE